MGNSLTSARRKGDKGGGSKKSSSKLRALLEETKLQDICEKQHIVVLKDNATVEQALKVCVA